MISNEDFPILVATLGAIALAGMGRRLPAELMQVTDEGGHPTVSAETLATAKGSAAAEGHENPCGTSEI